MKGLWKSSLLAVGMLGAGSALAQADAPVATTTSTTSTSTAGTGAATTTTTTTSTSSYDIHPAPLSMSEGWNTHWAMLFSLNNILVIGNVFGAPVDGTIGGDYHFNNRTALRMGASVGHTSNPVQVTKVVTTAGDQTISTYSINNPGGLTDAWLVNLRATYMWRLLENPISPYVGAGGQVGYTLNRNAYTDSQTVVGQRTQLNFNTNAISVSARAVAGVEWRFHPSFAVYADYSVNLAIYTNTHVSNATTVENTNSGTTSTVRTVTSSDTTSWFNLTTGVNQGASLGFEVFF